MPERTLSAVSRSKKGKQARSKTVVPNNRGYTSLAISKRTNTQGPRDTSPMSGRRQADPFANEKIAMSFRANNSMMQTYTIPGIQTPVISTASKPYLQMTKEEVIKKISE